MGIFGGQGSAKTEFSPSISTIVQYSFIFVSPKPSRHPIDAPHKGKE
jgi:hypothetical protein